MEDEDGNVLSDLELFKEALNHLSDSCCLAYEIDTPEGMAFAVMIDNALRYGQAIYHEKDPRSMFD